MAALLFSYFFLVCQGEQLRKELRRGSLWLQVLVEPTLLMAVEKDRGKSEVVI